MCDACDLSQPSVNNAARCQPLTAQGRSLPPCPDAWHRGRRRRLYYLRPLSDEQVVALVNMIAKDSNPFTGLGDLALVCLLLEVGLRLSEGLWRTFADIALAQGFGQVIGEGDEGRWVPLGDRARRVLHRFPLALAGNLWGGRVGLHHDAGVAPQGVAGASAHLSLGKTGRASLAWGCHRTACPSLSWGVG